MVAKKKSSQFSKEAVAQQQLKQELQEATAFSLSAYDNDPSSNPDGAPCRYFAVVSSGVDAFRLRVWDTRTSTLAAEHAAANNVKCTAVAWGKIQGGDDVSEKKKKRRRSTGTSESSQQVVALGLANGEVQLYSLPHGKVIRTLQGAHTAGVSDVTFAQDGTRAFSAGMDGLVVEWDIGTGAELGRFKADGKPIKRVQLNHDGSKLLTAGHAVKLWDTTTREPVKTYPGHASEVIRLCFNADSSRSVSAADDDRHVSVWDTTEKGPSDHLTSLTMDGVPTTIALSLKGQALALTEEGFVYLWKDTDRAETAAVSKKKKKHTQLAKTADAVLRIKSASEESKFLPILSATFSNDKVLIAHGSVIKPVFERVQFENEDGTLIKEITISRKPVSSLLYDNTITADAANGITTRYNEDSMLVLGAADLPAISGAKLDDGLTVDDQAALQEPTLEERLAAMSVAPTPSKSSKKTNRPPTANSLHQMLSQAIHTNDVQLLEQALQIHDSDIITTTIRRLPPSHVVPLLDQLMVRLQRRPNRARQLVEWVRAVLLVHSSYLMSLPQLTHNLSALYQTLDSRASVFSKLLRLSGRLDLVASQIAMRNKLDSNGNVQDNEALLVYDEEEESDDDDEDEVQDAVDGMDVDEDEGLDDDDDDESEDDDEDLDADETEDDDEDDDDDLE
ncbi:WD40-repeat-containing domain protein [Phlyctochytrium arcticum]|nr:WD40-repeat-containing domain protein [Phlyctochytrium arcticum]